MVVVVKSNISSSCGSSSELFVWFDRLDNLVKV